MGKDCCSAKEACLAQLRVRQAKVLKIVLAINAVMFCIEFQAGLFARSTALLADSLDMFGDASVYAFSLYVLQKGARWRATAALSKGVLMLVFGLAVLGDALLKVFHPELPSASTMGGIGLLALGANLCCLVLLLKHRDDDINMKSTWICSRNDIIANLSVLVAAATVASTKSLWPDIVIGLGLAMLFLRSAWSVLSEALGQWREAPTT